MKENCAEKDERKFPNKSGNVMQTSTYLTNYRTYRSQVFYRVVVLKI